MWRYIFTFIFSLFLFIGCVPEKDGIGPDDYLDALTGNKDIYPSVSPDGNQILFVHMNHENSTQSPTGLYLMDINGNNIELLKKGFIQYPGWSPDGTHISYTIGSQLFIFSLKDEITESFHFYNNLPVQFPNWSKDGQSILFSCNLTLDGGVFIISRDLSRIRRIFDPLVNNGSQAKWSSSNDKYIYAKGGQSWAGSEIFTIDTALTIEKRLTNDDYHDYTPSFSSDDSMIIWEKELKIYLMDSDGQNQRMIDYGRFPVFSPDSRYIIFSHVNDNYSREVIWRVDIDGKNRTQLTF